MLQFYRHSARSSEKLEVESSLLPDIDMFDNTLPLYMSHGDLNMRNILLERDGSTGQYAKVWLID